MYRKRIGKCIEKGLGNGEYLSKINIFIYLSLVFKQNLLPSLYFYTNLLSGNAHNVASWVSSITLYTFCSLSPLAFINFSKILKKLQISMDFSPRSPGYLSLEYANLALLSNETLMLSKLQMLSRLLFLASLKFC